VDAGEEVQISDQFPGRFSQSPEQAILQLLEMLKVGHSKAFPQLFHPSSREGSMFRKVPFLTRAYLEY
jgi:hypothetical protein